MFLYLRKKRQESFLYSDMQPQQKYHLVHTESGLFVHTKAISRCTNKKDISSCRTLHGYIRHVEKVRKTPEYYLFIVETSAHLNEVGQTEIYGHVDTGLPLLIHELKTANRFNGLEITKSVIREVNVTISVIDEKVEVSLFG